MGLANNILKSMHLPVSTWLSGESSVIPTLVFINLWTTGSTMVIFLAGIQDVPRELLEAVEIDGGGFWAKLRHVTIPMMTPTIFYKRGDGNYKRASDIYAVLCDDAGRSQ